MSNGGPQRNQPPWSHTYYHQYMQQHTQLTQWLQWMHRNTSTLHHGAHHCCCTSQSTGHNHCGMPQQHNCGVPQQHSCGVRQNCHAPAGNMGHVPAVNMGHVPAVNMGHAPAVNMSHAPAVNMGHAPAFKAGHAYPPVYHHPAVDSTQEPYAYGVERTAEYMGVDEGSEDSDDEEEKEEEDSEGELIFNVDAILEMRATREISDRDSMDSFELLDSVTDDMQEYVQLDNYGTVQRMSGKLPAVNMQEEEQNHKGQLEILYGEKASTIGGMEALLAVQFDHMYDTMQPTLWPVLPLLL